MPASLWHSNCYPRLLCPTFGGNKICFVPCVRSERALTTSCSESLRELCIACMKGSHVYCHQEERIHLFCRDSTLYQDLRVGFQPFESQHKFQAFGKQVVNNSHELNESSVQELKHMVYGTDCPHGSFTHVEL